MYVYFHRPGDCLLDVDGTNVLGLKMMDVGALINNRENRKNVNLRIWRYEKNSLEEEETGIALRGPLPEVATKLANAISGTVGLFDNIIVLYFIFYTHSFLDITHIFDVIN